MSTLKAMEVANIDFLIERLGQDCGELQFLREFTQNSLDAIRRSGPQEGHIVWNYVTLEGGVRKLAIVDNGCGMTGPDMLQYINKLSSGASEQGLGANFGLGAKIAGAVKNPHGLLYISKVAGDPNYYVVRLMKADGQYGLQLWGDETTGYDHYATIPSDALSETELDSLVLEQLRESPSGTQVIFYGDADSDDTAAGGTSQWVGKAINTRYFQFPANVRIQCRETSSGSGLRPTRGQKWALDKMAQASGVVDLQNARAHWWVLHPDTFKRDEAIKDDGAAKGIKSMATFQPAYHNKGHIGVIFQDELYNVSTGPAGYHKLQQFGVFMGMSQVVLYIEPTTKNVCANTSRTQVLLNGSESLPWLSWASEFQERMPTPLRDFIDSVDVKVDTSKDVEFVRNKISEILPLFDLPKFRRSPNGPEQLEAGSSSSWGAASPSEGNGPGSTRNPGPRNPAAPKPLLGGLKPGGPRGSKITVKDIPDIKILRGDKNHLSEECAAEYIANANRVHVNGDFRVFRALEAHYTRDLSHLPEALVIEHVHKAMDRWVMTVVAEVILGLRAMNSEHWTGTKINETLENKDAFTMALMPRLLLNHQLNREIKRELPKAALRPDPDELDQAN